jgi:hypothetical protein
MNSVFVDQCIGVIISLLILYFFITIAKRLKILKGRCPSPKDDDVIIIAGFVEYCYFDRLKRKVAVLSSVKLIRNITSPKRKFVSEQVCVWHLDDIDDKNNFVVVKLKVLEIFGNQQQSLGWPNAKMITKVLDYIFID